MGVYFFNQSDTDVRKLDPYKKLIADLKKLADFDSKTITLRWSGKQEGFKDGFYCDSNSICTSIVIKYSFHELPDDRIAIICSCEFGYNKCYSSHIIFDRVNSISLRLPYIYISCAEQLEAKCTLSDRICLSIEAVCKKEDIQDLCLSIMSHLVSILTLDN